MSMLMCPHCGWEYNPLLVRYRRSSPHELVPMHRFPRGRGQPECPGFRQHPRNPESDRRPLWKYGGVK